QPETFQREWLGEKRFELWKSGQLKFEDLAKPATSYRATTDDLTPPEEPPKPEPAPVADSPRLTGAAKSFVETLRARRQKTLSADEAAAIEAQESVYAAQRVAAAEANRNARNLEAEFREVNLQALREKDPAKKKELDELEAKTLRALAQARKEAEAAIDAAETAERERAGTIDVDAFLSALFGDDGDGENVFDDDKIAAIEKIFDAQGVGGAARPILERYNRIARYLGFSEADKDWKKYGFEELGQVLFVDLPENAGGEYDDNNCCINLNANGLKTRREASSSFAHEVGHWFELRVLGVDSAIKTEEWLRDAINAPPRRSDKELDRLGSTFWTLYDLRRCDVTFWRPDYYAAREYPTHYGNDYNYTPYHPTEVMSTAFEGLLTDPEAFARSSPEQFNRVIQAFEDFRKARSKNVDKPNKAPRSADAKAQAPQADEEFDLAASSEGLAQRFKRLAGFSSSSKAATETREKLKIDADYSKIPRDVAEEMNKELEKALEKFGSFGFVEKIEALDRTNALGSYDGKKGIIKLRPDLDLDGLKDEMEKSFKDDPRAYATRSRRHALRHEIGHAIMQAVKNKHFDTMGRLSELETQWEEREKKLKKLCREVLDNPALASTRAMANQFELVAEAFAVALLDDFEKKVIFKGGKKELAVKDAFAAKVILTLIGAL
ncbi:MAG: hypothetical protein IJE97_02360, partial [Thermoguttaceae bacterium]|nr:hypothetical protein [Thermoguttaceae bacterium]